MLKLMRAISKKQIDDSAAFGRLCVETSGVTGRCYNVSSAAFGRLCVETIFPFALLSKNAISRLRAAVC